VFFIVLQGKHQINNNYKLSDEGEQNITICQWRADQLFAEADSFCKKVFFCFP